MENHVDDLSSTFRYKEHSLDFAVDVLPALSPNPPMDGARTAEVGKGVTGAMIRVSMASTKHTSGVSKVSENVRPSVQRKCHSVMPRWYQMMA